MKRVLIYNLILGMTVPSLLRAEESPPPNPFGNLPSSNETNFDPFGENDDDDDFGTPNENFYAKPSDPGRFKDKSGTAAVPRGEPMEGSVAAGRKGSQNRLGKVDPAKCQDVVENFDYPDAEILDVAKAISRLTGKNFIFTPNDIKGRISVVSETRITVCDAWNAFLTAINMKGFALIPSGKYLRIERMTTAKEKQTPIYTDTKAPNNDEFITRVIPLRYIDATEFESTFRYWMPRDARMQPYGQTNTLIITDTAAHINRMMELIRLLDVAGYQESLVVMPIKNAAAKDIAKLIDQIITEGKGAAGGFGSPPRPAPTFNAPKPAGKTGRSGGSVISKIISDDRTNALIVKANAAGIREVRALVRRLDSKGAVNDGSGRIHVIHLRFGDAENISKTLGAITGNGGQRAANRPFPAFGGNADVAAFQGDIKVSPDKITQSLVITASPQDFAALKKVVDVLDVQRDQVFIEAMILEMSVGKVDAFGTSFISAANGIGLPSPNLINLLSGNPVPPGFVLGFKQGPQKAGITAGSGSSAQTFNVNSLNGLIELITNNSNTNIIANPQVVALDNEKATIEISEETKVPSTTTAATGVSTSSFTSEKAQLLLEVTPQINKASKFVKLDIKQKLENFDPTNIPQELRGKTLGRNIRSTETKLIVQDEDTVVLSGMMRNDTIEQVSKVPILGDIPVIGWLFKNTHNTVAKKNLLVFITPRIVKQYDTVRKVLESRLQERDEFAKDIYGSKDPMAKEVKKLRSRLPDLTVIEPMAKPNSQTLESQSFSMPSRAEQDDSDGYYEGGETYYPENSIPIPNLPVNPPSIGNDQPLPPVSPDNIPIN